MYQANGLKWHRLAVPSRCYYSCSMPSRKAKQKKTTLPHHWRICASSVIHSNRVKALTIPQSAPRLAVHTELTASSVQPNLADVTATITFLTVVDIRRLTCTLNKHGTNRLNRIVFTGKVLWVFNCMKDFLVHFGFGKDRG